MGNDSTGLQLFSEQNDSKKDEVPQDNKYLVFTLGTLRMASNLLDVREVIEPVPSQPIPNTVSYFKGVANVRGEIVGVVDLALMLGMEDSKRCPEIPPPKKNLFLVIEGKGGS